MESYFSDDNCSNKQSNTGSLLLNKASSTSNLLSVNYTRSNDKLFGIIKSPVAKLKEPTNGYGTFACESNGCKDSKNSHILETEGKFSKRKGFGACVKIDSQKSESEKEELISPSVDDSNDDALSNKSAGRKKSGRHIRGHPVQLSHVTIEIQKQPPNKKANIGFNTEKNMKEIVADQNSGGADVPKSLEVGKKNGVVSSEEEDEHESQGFWCFQYSRQQQLTLLSLCLVDFTSFLGMSIMAPFFPMEAAEKGMNEATVGFVFSTYALVMFAASPIFGYILPYVGSKFLFLSGLFIAGGCTVLFGILDEMTGETFEIFCFVIRSFEALGAAAYNTASCTMIADMFPDNVGAVFGLLETFVGLGSAVGPAIGGALYAVGGFKLPFILLGAFMILMVPINILLLPVNVTSTTKLKPGSTAHLLKLPTVMIVGLVIIVEASAWSFLDPFLEPHLSVFSLNTETVGLIFLMLAATYGIFCPIWGWVTDKWNRTSCLMVTGMIVTSFSLLLMGPSDLFPFLENELWLNMVALITMGVAVAMAIIPTFQTIMDYAIDAGLEDDVSTYSLVSGLWSAAYSLGDFIGPSVGGILVTSFGFPTAASGIAGLIALPAVILVIYEIILWSRTKPRTSSCISETIKNLPNDITEQTRL